MTEEEQVEQEDTEVKERIGRQFRGLRGPRTLEAQAQKMGVSRQRLAQIEAGDIPTAFLYLVRLAESDGADLNALLLTDNGARR